MREKWTEQEILALPKGEHDYFERKSGALYDDLQFREKLAKPISALANSGGGHIILGVEDSGEIDGVPKNKSKTPTREYLEQIIPDLVDPSLSKFRVHEVIRSPDSRIPEDKVVIVIDIGDSPHAPHQARKEKTYYYRPGGRSDKAPHFYLEALWNRAIKPELTATPINFSLLNATNHDSGIFLEIGIDFMVENSGRNAAQYWLVLVECQNQKLIESGKFHFKDLPGNSIDFVHRNKTMRTPLLPSLSKSYNAAFGLNLKPCDNTNKEAIGDALDNLFNEDLGIVYSVACENTRSEDLPLESTLFKKVITTDKILWSLPSNQKRTSLYGGHGIYCNQLSIYDSGTGYFDITYVIENRDGPNYSYLEAHLIFKDGHMRNIYKYPIIIEHLAKGVSREIKDTVELGCLKGYYLDNTEFVFLTGKQ